MERTRIAPTPSGFLHAGNAFNFLVTAGLAGSLGAELTLRIDDLDAERTRPEFVGDVFRSLNWLGIRWHNGPLGPDDFHSTWSQQWRLERYRSLVERLRGLDLLYPCDCSRTQLSEQERGGHRCRERTAIGAADGIPLRLRIPAHGVVEMRELNGRPTELDLAALMPDPVILQRGSGRPSYQIASLCDDLDQGITFIIRGADLLPSTACQLYLAEVLHEHAFGAIRFHHHPLTRDAAGQKLSKSTGSTALKSIYDAGLSADMLQAEANSYLQRVFSGFTR